jgi:hypothetical protein
MSAVKLMALHTLQVDIWDERKVFGSRSRTLREELLGDDPPADLPEQRAKPSNTIRIVMISYLCTFGTFHSM